MAPTENTNPGNFANRPQEEVQKIAQKGGQSNHSGGFANMDPDKQVGYVHYLYTSISILTLGVERYRLKGWAGFWRLIRAWIGEGESGGSERRFEMS